MEEFPTHHLVGIHELPVYFEKLKDADKKLVHTTGMGSVGSIVVPHSACDG